MQYKSEKTIFIYFVFGILISVFGIMIFAYTTEKDPIGVLFGMGIIGLLTGFLLHSFFNTNYTIYKTELKYQCGVIKGEIPIQKIRKIEYNNSIFVAITLKLGWSHKGLIIHYNQFDDVFISPKNRDQFTLELTQLNPNITIKK
ncbi:hypothetical protein GFJ94_11730 [Flavobacterium sp. LMO8]|uniref:PH domain-containing protein n=1 Tax=Flavobacterium sp. LMO8 TaxID=2654244 RepID=UPI0012921CC1|nr:PH domain-containing protein [Flavobacterium sp. LMO8]MQP25733.1 hypothetical protein [Flavobacterium sp. LMO8]